MAFKLQFITVSSDGSSRKVLDTIVLDASLSEVHESDADVTEFPVEEGANISDNVRQKPQTLQVEALISDFHLSNEGRTSASSGGPPSAQRPLGSNQIQNTNGATLKGSKGSARTTLLVLEDYQAKGTLIDVETGLKTYRNMVIKSIRTPRDKNLKNGIKCTINLQTIIVVKSQSVVIKQSVPKGQGVTPKGQQTPKASDGGKENQSLLLKQVDGMDSLKKAANEAIQAFKGNFGF